VAGLRVHGIVAGALVLLVGCAPMAGDAPAPSASGASDLPAASALPGLPDDTLPGYVVHRTGLDAAILARDALAPAELEALLREAGFEDGIEGRFTARRRRLTEVVARVLRFGDAGGASAYLAWFATHGEDLLGSQTQPAEAPGSLDGGVAFSHGVCDGCTKDTFQYVVAWTRGSYAITLRVGGPAAGPRTAEPLAAVLDEQVAAGG
jgi:hypothetical protein